METRIENGKLICTNVITKEQAQGIVQRTPNSSQVLRTEGILTGVTTNYFNAGYVETDGIDLELGYGTDLSDGILNLGLNLTHMLSYEIPIAGTRTDVVGLFNQDNFARSLPETKAVISANYLQGAHSAAAYVR